MNLRILELASISAKRPAADAVAPTSARYNGLKEGKAEYIDAKTIQLGGIITGTTLMPNTSKRIPAYDQVSTIESIVSTLPLSPFLENVCSN
jgi:hypothetical protein